MIPMHQAASARRREPEPGGAPANDHHDPGDRGGRVPARRGTGCRPALGIDAAPAADSPAGRPGAAGLLSAALPRQPVLPVLLVAEGRRGAGRADSAAWTTTGVRPRRRDGRAHRGGRALLPTAPSAGPRRGRLHRRRCSAGPGSGHAPARAAGRDRSRPRRHDIRSRGARAQPPDDRRLPQLRLRDDGAPDRRAASKGSCSRSRPPPAFEEHAAERSAQAAYASHAAALRAAVVAVVGASRERGKIGAEIFHNLHGTFRGRVVPDQSERGRDPRRAVLSADHGRPRPGRPRGHRRAGGRSRSGDRRLRGQGRIGRRRHHRRILRDRRGGAPARGRAPGKGARRGHADGRPELHGPRQHRSALSG